MELYRKTLGLIGAGKIGVLTANRARAFGMNILAYDPFVSRDNVYLAELRVDLVSLEDLPRQSDVVSCHLPATPATSRILNRKRFQLMKPTAYFINTSRGDVVEEAALLEVLQSGAIAGAALDVRDSEPPVPGELEKLSNVLLIPHIAALTREAQDRVTRAICDDVSRVLEGKPPINAVNKF
jgi:phosphoglycerate dehydrogenase-like enzyme